MKTLFKFLFVLSSLLVISCDDVEPTIYNGDVNNDGTFLSFSSTFYTLPIVINETGSLVITLNSSTISSQDRVYNLDLIEEESTANPATYTLPSTITIPANSYQGTITVTGQDGGLVDINPKPFVFRISNLDGEFMDSENVTVNVVEVCPLFDEFTGSYRVNQLTAGIGLNGGQHPIFGENSIIELMPGDSEFERMFVAIPYPTLLAHPEVTTRFNLVCGKTELSADVMMLFSCSDLDFVLKRGTISSDYNPNDDSVITITVTEDADTACNGPFQTTFRLTKVN